jgi:hypothetical protein
MIAAHRGKNRTVAGDGQAAKGSANKATRLPVWWNSLSTEAAVAAIAVSCLLFLTGVLYLAFQGTSVGKSQYSSQPSIDRNFLSLYGMIVPEHSFTSTWSIRLIQAVPVGKADYSHSEDKCDFGMLSNTPGTFVMCSYPITQACLWDLKSNGPGDFMCAKSWDRGGGITERDTAKVLITGRTLAGVIQVLRDSKFTHDDFEFKLQGIQVYPPASAR